MTPIQNPHAFQSSFTQGQPAALPVFPLGDKPKSDAGREAKRLHDAATVAARQLQAVRDSATEATAKLRAARQALDEELVRGAREGIDHDKQQKLSIELSAAERLADQQTFRIQYAAAVEAQRDAVRAYKSYAWTEYATLLEEELAAEAHAASAALVKALATIEPVQARYNAIKQRVWDLSQITVAGEHADFFGKALAIAPEPQPPLPDPAAVEQFAHAVKPPEPVVEPEEQEFVEGDEDEDEAA